MIMITITIIVTIEPTFVIILIIMAQIIAINHIIVAIPLLLLALLLITPKITTTIASNRSGKQGTVLIHGLPKGHPSLPSCRAKNSET